MSYKTIAGVICPGYGIASETATKSQTLVSNVYPDKREIVVDKTVFRQFPYFIQAGVEGLEHMRASTINVDISPKVFLIRKPDYEITCEWIPGIKETFWLTKMQCEFNGVRYDAYNYYPCISEQHVARNHMVEVITELIPGIAYGKDIVLHMDDVAVEVTNQK